MADPSTMTVAQLKRKLTSLSLPTDGLKPALVQRLSAAYETSKQVEPIKDEQPSKKARKGDINETKQPSPLVLFRRKSTRVATNVVSTISATDERFLQSLEKGHRTDCYIKLNEGFVPAHCIILEKCRTIYSAFASNTQESKTMTFDMSSWDSNLVLDVIEMLYTNTTSHFLPLTTDDAIKLYELLVFLDHDFANKLLLQVAVSALYTMEKIEDAPNYCKRLSRVISQLYLGPLTSDDPDTIHFILFQALWIATEAGVPEFDEPSRDILVELFCRGNFCKDQQKYTMYREPLSYFCSLSFNTVRKIIQKCMLYCREYNHSKIMRFVARWILFDPVNRMNGLDLLRHLCLDKIPATAAIDFLKVQTSHVSHVKQHLQHIEQARNDGIEISPIIPFTLPPSYPELELTDETLELDENLNSVFVFGVEVLLKWAQAVRQQPNHPSLCLTRPHNCKKFPKTT